jgi:hypothetical protein
LSNPTTFSNRTICGDLPFVAYLISFIMRIASKKRPDFPLKDVLGPATDQLWHGLPNPIIWTGGILPPSTFVISPKCSILGKWRFVTDIAFGSISLAQRVFIPKNEAA